MNANVSIIVPAYNAARFLPETLESLIAQNDGCEIAPCEIIVVDDGSTDATPRVAKQFGDRVRYVHQSNAGVSAARNRGLGLATGEWVMFVDADDQLLPGAVESLLTAAAGKGDCVVYGHRLEVDVDGNRVGEFRSPDCTGPVPAAARVSFGAAPFAPGSAIVARRLADRARGFDTRFSTCADRDFWIRCGCIAEFHDCGEFVYRYRLHPQGMSRDLALHADEAVRVRIEALDWARERGVAIFERDPLPEDILAAHLHDVFWARRWNAVDALLRLADERRLENDVIRSIRRRRRLPGWVYACKDRLDQVKARAGHHELAPST